MTLCSAYTHVHERSTTRCLVGRIVPLLRSPGCTVGAQLCGTTSLDSTRLSLLRSSRPQPLVVVLSLHDNIFRVSHHKGFCALFFERWFDSDIIGNPETAMFVMALPRYYSMGLLFFLHDELTADRSD